MALDFQEIHRQIQELGELAPRRQRELEALRARAEELLARHARDAEALRAKVELAARQAPGLRCAVPLDEPLDQGVPLPPLPASLTAIAADGSQIAPDRHAEVYYSLINVGAIQMEYGSPDPPRTFLRSQLLFDESLYTPTGMLTDGMVALLRDLNERRMLLELAERASVPPVVTFADGPLELWGARDSESASQFQARLQSYLEVLARLCELGVGTAGYVDKPAASPVVRLLEIAMTPEAELAEALDRQRPPLQGVTDRALFVRLLAPGERSAVFAFHSKSGENYRGDLALHFFYLNVGRPGHPYLARVEIPAWVVRDRRGLDVLHAALVHQCRILEPRPYPYLLHRAHETAVVSQREKERLTQLIALEMRRRGVPPDDPSSKGFMKVLRGRRRHRL